MRLALEGEQLPESDDVMLDHDGVLYRSIRAGAWDKARIVGWFQDKGHSLERLYGASGLPHQADEAALRRLVPEYSGDVRRAPRRGGRRRQPPREAWRGPRDAAHAVPVGKAREGTVC